MRVLIRSNWSKNIQALTAVCSESHKASCRKWGYDYKFNDFDRHGLFRTERAKGMAIFYTVSIAADSQ